MELQLPMERFFNNGKFSDLTLKFSDQERKVHKVVLCSRSSWFASACEGEFKESSEPIIELFDDNPFAVDQMLRHFYEQPITLSEDSEEEALEQVLRIYAAADKYDASELRQQLLAKFSTLAESYSGKHPIGDLGSVIEQAYEQTGATSPLRATLVRLFLTKLKDTPDAQLHLFRTLLVSLPDFSADLAIELARGRVVVPTSSRRGRRTASPYRVPAYQAELHSAAGIGDVERCKELLDEGEDVDIFDGNGETPLTYSAYYGHLEATRLLVERGANVNSKGLKTRTWTALQFARQANHTAIVEYLLSVGGRDE